MSERDILERRVYFSRLYDLYGPLLTERQRHVYELHEIDDLSLSEISEELKISRQGVSDQIQRVRERLDEIERSLGFEKRIQRIVTAAEKLRETREDERASCVMEILDACGERGAENV